MNIKQTVRLKVEIPTDQWPKVCSNWSGTKRIFVCVPLIDYVGDVMPHEYHENNVLSRLSSQMALWQLMHLGTWYTQTVHHVSKCLSYHKAIVVISGRAHFFQITHIYYAHLTSVRFEHSVDRYRGSLKTIHKYIYIYIYSNSIPLDIQYFCFGNIYIYIYIYV